MKSNDIILQAESFLNWHDRAGGDLETNFRWWAQGKDFQPEDEANIWAVVTTPGSIRVDESVARVEELLVSVE